MVIWKLKEGDDRRLRSQHPWVFSNELQKSPKGHFPGAPVEIQDYKGQFIARGYGNPNSLISFRALSFDPQDREPWSINSLIEKLIHSWRMRKQLGFKGSFRLCFGEADFIPGLVVDYYLCQTNQGQIQVFTAQILTAGMDFAIKDLNDFFKLLNDRAVEENLTTLSWDQTAVVQRNDVGIRKLEGMQVIEPLIVKNINGIDLKQIDILLNSASDDQTICMQCDLHEGQKTGFFLDQTENIYLVVQQLTSLVKAKKLKKIKVLDLCCYVGHWSTQIARAMKNLAVEVEISQVDVSKSALAFAKTNAEREGAVVTTCQLDVLEGLGVFQDNSFDIIIADPPAFIKAKKDIPTGKHAYLKMNSQAFRICRRQGILVSCSCSGLLTEDDFREAIRKASVRNKKSAQCIGRGGHASDHPLLMSFEEGFYLKMYVNWVS